MTNLIQNDDVELISFYQSTIQDPDLESLQFHIEKTWIEVQNGLEAAFVVFETTLNPQILYSKIQETILQLKKNPYRWCIECYCCNYNKKFLVCSFKLISSYKNSKSFLGTAAPKTIITDYQSQTIINKARILYSLPIHDFTQNEREILIPWLKSESTKNHRTLSTLASEILTNWGVVTVPLHFMVSEEKKIDSNLIIKNPSLIPRLFEDRIDVNAYNYFELVHPSYARQCVAIANQIIKNTTHDEEISLRCLDIGTGPGSALLMQNELLPTCHFLAIEPSDVAFIHLAKNVANYSNITPLHIDFLEFETPEKFNLILSTGASHHLNTYAFFQKSSQLLQKEGLFLIADEMISPYSTKLQRKTNVMIHHSIYILELLSRLYSISSTFFSEKEQILCNLLKNNIPLAYTLAKLSLIDAAELIYKNLLKNLKDLNLGINLSSPYVTFYRLMFLELEALVAGIDYDIEQKTYPEMFIKLANLAHLQCIYHECVHSTSGNHEMGSGTHIFVFKH